MRQSLDLLLSGKPANIRFEDLRGHIQNRTLPQLDKGVLIGLR